MLGLKDAYEILGVKDGAPRDEIVKRYDVLLKKYRMRKPDEVGKDSLNLEDINMAYNLLMGYDTGEKAKITELDRMPSSNPLLRKLNINERRLSNFFYYYKFHIIIGIIAAVILVFTVKSIIGRVPPDINIAFIGDYFFNETDSTSFTEKIKSKLPQLKEISSEVVSLSENADGQQAYAMQMKAVTLMAAGEIDLFILDKVNFEKYASQNAFMNLDDISGKTLKAKAYSLKAEGESTEHVYGIDLGANGIMPKNLAGAKEMIAAVRVKAKFADKAVELIKVLTE